MDNMPKITQEGGEEMNPMTKEQRADIDSMTQEDMAMLWRFSGPGHPYFDKRNEAQKYFSEQFKGFTPEISKSIGWKRG